MKRRWRRRLLIVAALYFTFLGGTFVTDHNYLPRVLHHVLVTVLVAAWVATRIRQRRVLPNTSLDAPLLLFLAVNTLVTVFAVDPRVSVEFLWRLAVHTWLFYAIAGMFARGHGRDVLEALFLASAVAVLVGVFEIVSWYFGISAVIPIFEQGWFEIGGLSNPIPPRIHRLNFTLGFSTGLSAYFATLIPMGLAFALTGRERETRQAFWLWVVGALLMEGLSFSRGGLLSLAVSLPTFAVLALAGDEERRRRLAALVKQPRVLAVAAVAFLVVFIIGFGWTRQQLTGHRSGDVVRLDLWRSALEIFRENPAKGVGPYGFGRALRDFRNPSIVGDRHLTADNRALTTLAETGLLGFVALLWLCVRFIRMGYHRWRAASGSARLRLAAAVAGVVGFGVHNLVDTFTATSVLLPMLVLSAFVTHESEDASVTSVPNWRLVVGRSLLVTLVVFSAVGWLISDLAQWHFQQSLRFAGRGDLETALVEARRAAAIDPALGLYGFQEAYILGQMAAQNSSALDRAIEAYESSLALENSYDLHHANLSALYEQAGQTEAARAEMNRAHNVLLDGPAYAFWLGGYAESAEEHDAARLWYEEALARQPEWAASPYWATNDWRVQFLDVLVADSGRTELLLAVGSNDGALALALDMAEAHSDSLVAQVEVGEAALRAGEPHVALEALDAALALNPANAEAYALRAEARLAVGDVRGAERDARTAIFLGDLDAGQRARRVLGQIAEAGGDLEAAEEWYLQSGPAIVVSQGWDVAVYGRKADFRYLPQLALPGPDPRAYDGWLALADLYLQQGRDSEANEIFNAIRAIDPYFEF